MIIANMYFNINKILQTSVTDFYTNFSYYKNNIFKSILT